MFLGEYQHTLDAKGRLILPVDFRARLAGGCVLTRGQETCLSVYAPDEFDRIAEKLSRAPQGNASARNLIRQFFSGARQEVPDKQGRVMIPEPLRAYAHLQRDVAVIGAGLRIEVWDRPTWTEQQQRTEPEYRDLDIEGPGVDF